MVRVAVTGVGGLLGRNLLALLSADDDVERVVGIDVRVPPDLAAEQQLSPTAKLELHEGDVRDAEVAELFDEVDAVVHLAFQLNPSRDEAAMRSINVDGTRNVFEAAAVAGVRKIVYASSAVAYGAHPDNDFPLTETNALRANADFSYAEHKAEIERFVAAWAGDHPELVVTVLRPAIVAGPGIDNFITRQLEMPRMTMVRGHRPPWQFVHVDDVAAALAHAVANDLPGAYNVASEGWLSWDEVVAVSGRKVLELPEEVAFSLAERMWRLGLGEAPAGEVNYLMHPWVVSVDKLRATGWQPRHSNRDALAALVAEHGDRMTLGPIRTTRGRLRAIGAGTATVLVALVAGALWRRVPAKR